MAFKKDLQPVKGYYSQAYVESHTGNNTCQRVDLVVDGMCKLEYCEYYKYCLCSARKPALKTKEEYIREALEKKDQTKKDSAN